MNDVITQDILDAHPEYVQAGLNVGDPIPVLLTNEQLNDTEDFTVTQEFLDLNPGLEYEVGEVIQVPKHPAPDAVKDTPTPSESVPTQAIAKPLIYSMKEVISHGLRMVGDNQIHHLRLEDGSECDITNEEYDVMIANSRK